MEMTSEEIIARAKAEMEYEELAKETPLSLDPNDNLCESCQ